MSDYKVKWDNHSKEVRIEEEKEFTEEDFWGGLGAFGGILVFLAAFLPLFALQNMIAGIANGEIGSILLLLVISVTIAVHARKILKSGSMISFWETWGRLFVSSTTVTTVVALLEGIFTGRFEFWDIFVFPFSVACFTALPSLTGALVIVAVIAAKNKKAKHRNSQ